MPSFKFLTLNQQNYCAVIVLTCVEINDDDDETISQHFTATREWHTGHIAPYKCDYDDNDNRYQKH